MKAYTIKSEICCENCKDVFEADYNKAANELDAQGVAEWMHDTDNKAKCIYCDTIIEHDSELVSQLHQKADDIRESDIADKAAWHNGRFGR